MISYWEKAHFLAYEHIVVGAGIVGLSVAIELKHRYPNCSVLVLERGVLPTGASTRNAGFACMGSVTELLADLETMTETEVTALFAMRKQGLELLRSRLGDNTIDYAEYGSHEIITDNALHCLDKIPYINALLAPHTGNKPAFSIATHKIPDTGFNPQYAKALIANNCEGQLNSGKMMRALQHLASSKGVDILTGADVTSIQEEDGYVAVSVFDNTRQDSVIFTAKKLSICTNAFTKKLLPNEDITPGRGQVLITNPIPGLRFSGIYHFEEGYYYFREINGCVLMGGGRNLDFEGETTTEIELNTFLQANLEEKLKQIVIPNTPFTVAQRWAGIMAFGKTKMPIVKAVSPRIFGAFRMGGMGVAIGSLAAKQMVDLMQ